MLLQDGMQHITEPRGQPSSTNNNIEGPGLGDMAGTSALQLHAGQALVEGTGASSAGRGRYVG